MGSDGWVCFSAWWGCSISFWKPHSDDIALMAFAEGQFPSENPISTSEGFKTSSKYDGNNCLWIFPRNLGEIFFLFLNLKRNKGIAACVVLGKEEEPQMFFDFCFDARTAIFKLFGGHCLAWKRKPPEWHCGDRASCLLRAGGQGIL